MLLKTLQCLCPWWLSWTQIWKKRWRGEGQGMEWYKLWAFPSCSLIKHLYYSEFKTLFSLDVLKGSRVTSWYRQDSYLYFFSASDCALGFAIVHMGSLGWEWK